MVFLFAVQAGAFGASSSAGYRMTTEILDSGAASGSSASYRLLGKARERQQGTPSSTNFIIGEGFLRSVYFSTVVPVLSPVVTSISPAAGVNTGAVTITDLSGANFQSGASVKLSKSGQADISATSVAVVSSSKITCTLNITGAAGGLWNVTVINPDGRSGSLPSAFNVTYPAPAIVSITPAKGNNDGTVNITDLAGTGFRSGAAVKLSKTGESDILADSVAVESSTKVSCRLNLTGKTVGAWDVTLTNDDNQAATMSGGFKIEAPGLQVIGAVVSTQNPYNPATGTTTIKYTLSKDANIKIFVYNLRGERVWEWTAPSGGSGGQAGVNEIVWDGMTAFKSKVSFGVYIVSVVATDGGQVKELAKTKIAVIK